MLPDVVVNIGSPATPSTDPTDTGQCFAPLITQRGSTANPILLRSMSDYTSYFGARQTTSIAYDWAEDYFGERGAKLWVSRVYGAGATQATLNLLDGSAGVSLVVKAGCNGDPDPGTWANGATGGLSVAVVAVGSQYQLQVLLGGVLVETSPPFTTQADAVGWSAGANLGTRSRYLQITLGVSTNVPAVAAAASLAGGTDGSATTNTDQQSALDRILPHLGPGQVAVPGVTTSAVQLMAIAHAVANNRFALLDGADTATDSTLESAAASLYTAPNSGRRFAQFAAPWDVIPGLSAFSTRTVPPSARIAAQYAKIDALGNPNLGAMGNPRGNAVYAQDLSQPSWTNAQRLALNNAGVTISRRRFGGIIRTYGMRTLADQIQDANWSMAPGVRTVMWYVAQAKILGELFEGEQVNRQTLLDYAAALYGPAKELSDRGALYGDTPSDRFSVIADDSLNPPAQLAQGIMVATVQLRVAPTVEQATINVVKVPVTQGLE